MLARPLLLGVFFVIGAQCYFGELEPIPDNPFSHSHWNWRSPDLFGAESRKAIAQERDIEGITERDREALAPDYTDPTRRPKDDSTKSTARPEHSSFNPGVIPGGVVDVEAGDFGFPNGFPQIPDTFGFASSFGNRNPGGIFGLGGFFGPVAEQKPWWKGKACAEIIRDPELCNFIDEFHRPTYNFRSRNDLFQNIFPEVDEMITEFDEMFPESGEIFPGFEDAFPKFDETSPEFEEMFPEFDEIFSEYDKIFPRFNERFPLFRNTFHEFEQIIPEIPLDDQK